MAVHSLSGKDVLAWWTDFARDIWKIAAYCKNFFYLLFSPTTRLDYVAEEKDAKYFLHYMARHNLTEIPAEYVSVEYIKRWKHDPTCNISRCYLGLKLDEN